MVDVCIFGFKIVCNCMIKHFFHSSLPLLLVYMFYVWFSLFAMIINLLMGADARNSCGHQGDGGFAA